MIGFMSMDGSFTACKIGRHCELAKSLVYKHYKINLDEIKAEQFLLHAGWIEFREDLLEYSSADLVLTTPQRQKLYEWLNNCCCNYKQKAYMKELLKYDALMREGMLASM